MVLEGRKIKPFAGLSEAPSVDAQNVARAG
jgi:hypothetical protein